MRTRRSLGLRVTDDKRRDEELRLCTHGIRQQASEIRSAAQKPESLTNMLATRRQQTRVQTHKGNGNLWCLSRCSCIARTVVSMRIGFYEKSMKDFSGAFSRKSRVTVKKGGWTLRRSHRGTSKHLTGSFHGATGSLAISDIIIIKRGDLHKRGLSDALRKTCSVFLLFPLWFPDLYLSFSPIPHPHIILPKLSLSDQMDLQRKWDFIDFQ